MKRREFLKGCFAGIACGIFPQSMTSVIKNFNKADAAVLTNINAAYIEKIKNFDKPHEDDVYLKPKEVGLLNSSLSRLKRVQHTVGYGNFCLLNFDQALRIARHYISVGGFTREETDFLEMIFYNNAQIYGFFGLKPLNNITDRVFRSETVKIRNTGNYLYNGLALDTYKKIKEDVGENVVLTSGIRSVIKQFYLFLDKVRRSGGNLSLASRSLAPPGYSYHGIGDFDVGQAEYGALNFTIHFTKTDVYKKLIELGYINFRYPEDNNLGVRFEPWHIKLKA